jgi:hypothetical protein
MEGCVHTKKDLARPVEDENCFRSSSSPGTALTSLKDLVKMPLLERDILGSKI